MLGPSRESLREVRRSLVARRDEPGFAELFDELLAVARLLGETPALRRTLADAGIPVQRRQALVQELLGQQLSPLAHAVVRDVVAERWSTAADLTDAVEQLGAEAAFVVAERERRLDRIEDELFRFGRIAESQPQLLTTLDDAAVAPGERAAVIEDLLRGKADPATVTLLEQLVRSSRGRRFEAALAELGRLAAARRDQLVADVRVAAPLTAEQERRLATALARTYDTDVHLQVSVDPQVLGGVVVRVGDEVIDGSIATRLEQARRSLAS